MIPLRLWRCACVIVCVHWQLNPSFSHRFQASQGCRRRLQAIAATSPRLLTRASALFQCLSVALGSLYVSLAFDSILAVIPKGVANAPWSNIRVAASMFSALCQSIFTLIGIVHRGQGARAPYILMTAFPTHHIQSRVVAWQGLISAQCIQVPWALHANQNTMVAPCQNLSTCITWLFEISGNHGGALRCRQLQMCWIHQGQLWALILLLLLL